MVHPYGMIKRPNHSGYQEAFPTGKGCANIKNTKNNFLTSAHHNIKTNTFASRREATIGNLTQ